MDIPAHKSLAFLFVSGMMLLSGIIWLFGMKYLAADTAAVENQPPPETSPAISSS